jgi:predicted Zn-dependent peptidase
MARPPLARADIENLNIDHLREFYQRYYQADNAALIITGSFDVAKMPAFLLGDNLNKDRDFDWQVKPEDQAKRLTGLEVNRVIAGYCPPLKWSRVIAGDFAADKPQ